MGEGRAVRFARQMISFLNEAEKSCEESGEWLLERTHVNNCTYVITTGGKRGAKDKELMQLSRFLT